MAEASEVKKTRKKRVVTPTKFVATTKQGITSLVDSPAELAALYAANPGSESYVLGKKVKVILVETGKHNLITGEKGEQKISIALEK